MNVQTARGHVPQHALMSNAVGDPLLPRPGQPEEVLVTYPYGPGTNVRLIESPTSNLVLGIAGWHLRQRLLDLPQVCGSSNYAIVGSTGQPFPDAPTAIYWGATDKLQQRLRRHSGDLPVVEPRAVLVIAGAHLGVLSPDMSEGLEWLLSRLTRAHSVFTLVNAFRQPNLRPAQITTRLRWVESLRPMLQTAGYPIIPFEEPDAGIEPEFGRAADARTAPPQPPQEAELTSGAVPAVRSGWSTSFPSDLEQRSEAQRFVLSDGEVEARAVVCGAWTVIEAGAIGRRHPVPSHQSCLTDKLEAMIEAGVLRPIPGRPHLVRLMRSIAVPSLLNARRLLCGNNGPASGWLRLG